MPAPHHTVAIAFVRSAVQALAPPRRASVLQACGIAPVLLAEPQARVPASAFGALWMALARALDDEFFGLDARRMKPGSFALLCHALAAQPTVGQGLRIAVRGFGVFFDDVAPRLEVAGDRARLAVEHPAGHMAAEARRFADETLLVMLHGLLCWMAGRRVPLRELAMAHPRPAHAEEYARMFCGAMHFDAPRTEVAFDAAVLGAPAAVTPRALRDFLREAPQSVFLKQVPGPALGERVRRRLRRDGAWPTIDALAAEWGMSPATLRRRLDAEGAGWSALKDEVRRDLAIHLLAQHGPGLGEIAERLGFGDVSSFHRAFRKWTGSPPGAYRAARGPGVRGAP